MEGTASLIDGEFQNGTVGSQRSDVPLVLETVSRDRQAGQLPFHRALSAT